MHLQELARKNYKWLNKKHFALIPILFLVGNFATGSAFAQKSRDIALILKVKGQVGVNRGTNGTWEVAKRGMRLNSGNVVKTGENSLAAMVFTDDKSLIKIRSNSQITIKGKREKAKVKKSIFMRLGQLWAKVTKGSPFQVETPSGVAAVKGTEFYVTMDEAGNMAVFCLDGLIDLIKGLVKVELTPGDKGQILQDALPEKSKSSPDEIPNWAGADDGINELQIEFEDENGNKKILKIRYK